MALFGSARDASLIRSINRELINDYIDTEVGFYKLNLESSRANLYGESDNKVYYARIKMNAIIEFEEKSRSNDEYGLDYTRNAIYSFLRDDLKDRNIVIEEGDIIEYNNEYFEVDNVSSTQYWSGRNPSADIGLVTGERGEFGYSVAVRCETHVTRRNRLNIEEVRSGVNRPNDMPRNL